MFIELLQKKYRMESNFVGIGAVFEWVAGTKVKAPEFIANLGLEWLLRLVQEPRRLFKRYFIDNFLFLYLITKQYISKK
jgi:N-acetylglucosaminyldiphosphoundecaprenol N-acetyl-beta-D-mannosaminyltransferase